MQTPSQPLFTELPKIHVLLEPGKAQHQQAKECRKPGLVGQNPTHVQNHNNIGEGPIKGPLQTGKGGSPACGQKQKNTGQGPMKGPQQPRQGDRNPACGQKQKNTGHRPMKGPLQPGQGDRSPACGQKQNNTGQGPMKGPFQLGQGIWNPSCVQKQNNTGEGLIQTPYLIPTVTVSSNPASQYKQSPKSQPSVPGQFQTPMCISNPTSNSMVTLVGHTSPKPLGRSHSPCRRIDVETKPEKLSGLRLTASQENLRGRLESEDIEQSEPLSQSYPFHFVQAKRRNSYSHPEHFDQVFSPCLLPLSVQIKPNYLSTEVHEPFSSEGAPSAQQKLHSCSPVSGSFLQVPGCHPKLGSSKHNLMRSRSYEHMFLIPPSAPVSWLALSPRASPQNIQNPLSTKSQSSCFKPSSRRSSTDGLFERAKALMFK